MFGVAFKGRAAGSGEVVVENGNQIAGGGQLTGNIGRESIAGLLSQVVFAATG